MKMPVGEKKKRKDKEGEKVGRRKFGSKTKILFQTYHALWPYYSVVFNTPKKTVEVG